MTRTRTAVLALAAVLAAVPVASAKRDDLLMTSRVAGEAEPAANDALTTPQLSADGRYALFVDSDDTQAYVYDVQTGEAELVSRATGEEGAAADAAVSTASISADGRYVVFSTTASNVAGVTDDDADADVFRRDLETDETVLVSATADNDIEGDAFSPTISGDGNLVAFQSDAPDLVGGDGNATFDVFVRDIEGGDTSLLSRDSEGVVGDAASYGALISRDGTRVAFRSDADNLSDSDDDANLNGFLAEVGEERVKLIADPPGDETADSDVRPTSISADGSRVVFDTSADNLSDADADGVIEVFVWDDPTGEIILATPGVTEPAGQTTNGVISGEGRFVAFDTDSDSLLPVPENPDTTATRDVGMADLVTGEIRLVSRAAGADGEDGDSFSFEPSISDDGRFVVFHSLATNFSPDAYTVHQYRREVRQPPAVTASPQVAGSPVEGRTVSCAGAAFTAATGTDYAWLRDGTAIPGAGTAEYTLTAADVGRQLACQAVGTSPDGPAVAISPPVTGLPARVAPTAVSFDVSPSRDRRAPYRYRVTGRVVLPAGLTKERACNGRVRIRAKKGKRTVVTKQPAVRSACAFAAKLTVSARRARSRRGKLRLTVRFLGNDALFARSATARRLRFGR